MIRLYNGGVYLVNGKELVPEQETEKIRSLCGKIPERRKPGKGLSPGRS